MQVVADPQQRAWVEGESSTVALMGAINLAVAELVSTIRMLIDTDGWGGHGIKSVEHWVTWKAGISARRAADLVRVARRIEELPACWALFQAGKLTEDAMVRIARRVPACRDAEVAGWAPGMLISQLARALKSCPELPNPDPNPKGEPDRERFLRLADRPDGWGRGEFSLPPEEMASLRVALQRARDVEYRDRHGLGDHEEITGTGNITWADAFNRLAHEALDALDPTLMRTGRRGERTKVVLHHDLNPDGSLGPGQLHLGPVIRDSVAHFLSCDAEVMVAAYQAGQLIGIKPHRTHRQHPPPPSHRTPRPRLHPPPLRPEPLAPHPPHRPLGRQRAHPALEPDRPVPNPSQPDPPRRAPSGRQPRDRDPALLRQSRNTDRTTPPPLAQAAPPRRAQPLHPTLRRTPRRPLVRLELTRRAHAGAPGSALDLNLG